MKPFITLTGITFVLFLLSAIPLHARQIKLVIHGGAGTICRSTVPDSVEEQYRANLIVDIFSILPAILQKSLIILNRKSQREIIH